MLGRWSVHPTRGATCYVGRSFGCISGSCVCDTAGSSTKFHNGEVVDVIHNQTYRLSRSWNGVIHLLGHVGDRSLDSKHRLDSLLRGCLGCCKVFRSAIKVTFQLGIAHVRVRQLWRQTGDLRFFFASQDPSPTPGPFSLQLREVPWFSPLRRVRFASCSPRLPPSSRTLTIHRRT